MLDHVSIRVQDSERALAFYRAALEPLGYTVVMEYPGGAGLGAGAPDLWLNQSDQPIHRQHIALSADRSAVDAFHAAAVAAGGTDNGAPGVRADYHPHYYAAFVLDPDGNNVEVVCHVDPTAKPARPVAKPAAKKSAAKAAAKPAATKKAAARKPAPKKAAATKTASAKKPAVKKSPAKKTSGRRASGKKRR